ncbi:DUF5681 domain-containing protein [Altererythrobacter sp. GH1-8]|uniref:DUF5681 domain-containing protein n=1 Tax=Altererythrobacter sp. GH1-8 TaxID=3349333 RepID=UPI00374D6098
MAKQPSSPPRKAVRKRGPVAKRKPDAGGATGPGNPPMDTRFKPGQSGNPAGRPRKERSLLKLVEAELDAEMQLTENGEQLRLTKREALAKRMVHDALKGDARAIAALLKLLGPDSGAAGSEHAQVPLEAVLGFLERNRASGPAKKGKN